MKDKSFIRPKGGVRLSNNVIPIKYNVQLKPDLDNFTFEGIETILINISKTTKNITLHSKELEIETVEVELL